MKPYIDAIKWEWANSNFWLDRVILVSIGWFFLLVGFFLVGWKDD